MLELPGIGGAERRSWSGWAAFTPPPLIFSGGLYSLMEIYYLLFFDFFRGDMLPSRRSYYVFLNYSFDFRRIFAKTWKILSTSGILYIYVYM